MHFKYLRPADALYAMGAYINKNKAFYMSPEDVVEAVYGEYLDSYSPGMVTELHDVAKYTVEQMRREDERVVIPGEWNASAYGLHHMAEELNRHIILEAPPRRQ